MKKLNIETKFIIKCLIFLLIIFFIAYYGKDMIEGFEQGVRRAYVGN